MRQAFRSRAARLAYAGVTTFGLTAQAIWGFVSGLWWWLLVLAAWGVFAWLLGVPQWVARRLREGWAEWGYVSRHRYRTMEGLCNDEAEARKKLEDDIARYRFLAGLYVQLQDLASAGRASRDGFSETRPNISSSPHRVVRMNWISWHSQVRNLLGMAGYRQEAESLTENPASAQGDLYELYDADLAVLEPLIGQDSPAFRPLFSMSGPVHPGLPDVSGQAEQEPKR